MYQDEGGPVTAGLAMILAATGAFMAAFDGRPHAGLPAGKLSPGAQNDHDDGPRRSPPEQWAETFGDLVGRAARSLGARGDVWRGRIEGVYGMYKLLRALGLTDQEIAALVAKQVRWRVERGVAEIAPTPDDVRRAGDGLEETIIRAAQDVDVRLGLGGEFVRRVRESVQASRAGRENTFTGVERGMATAREQLRRLLRDQA